MKNKFEILQWDSNFFGFKVAKINDFDSVNEFNLVREELQKEQVKLAYVFCEPNSKSDQILKSSDVFLADEKVTFSRFIEVSKDNSNASIEEYIEGIVNDKMLDIAIQTSEYSRFRVDVNFKNEEFKKLYYQWIKNAVEDRNTGKLFVYQENTVLKGLIYLKEINDKIGNISLIGVDEGYRGEQIGTKLIEKATSYFSKLGKKEVQVVTQKANVLACNFYTKNGFQIIDTVNVYHLWL